MEVAEVAGAILPEVDTGLAVELTQQVCRIPSVLGEEGPLADFLASVMKDLGFERVSLQPALPRRPNSLGELSFGPGRRVLLTGHMDTKPVSRGWTEAEPFSGELLDGRIYGHGIMDMKAALACQVAALASLRKARVPLGGVAAFAAVSDHMGDQAGSIAYFDAHAADLCVLGELTDNQICLGHRGRYYFDVVVEGRSAHTCHKDKAINANYLAALAVIELEASNLRPPLEAWVRALFGPETYLSPGRIYGGLPPGGPSMIPDECVVRVDARPQPGVSVDVVRAEIDRCLRAAKERDSNFRAVTELADVKKSYLADRESEVVRLMVEALREVKGIPDPTLTVAGWLGDTASFGYKVPTVIFGPGGEPVYCPNEHLSVRDIHEATRTYALFAALALLDDADRS